MLVEPEFKGRPHESCHQLERIARIEFFLDLTLKLRIEHLGAEHIARARKHVLGHELDSLGQQGVELDETLHGLKEPLAQSTVVGAARRRGDEVDIAFAQRGSLFGKGHAPGHAFAIGKLLAALGVLLALEGRHHRIGRQALQQIVPQPSLVLPVQSLAGLFLGEPD